MLTNQLKEFIKGEIANDEKTLQKYSRDASLFEVKPETVVFPKDSEDIKKLVQFISRRKSALGLPEFALLSITARCGGTDMTGGDLGESIVIDFTKHFNKIYEVDSYGDGGGYARAQPGVFYRDFEKETLKAGLILPPFPASREICAIGGMVANNAGGEKSLIYGKTENFVEELDMILSDGNEYTFKKLNEEELEQKKSLQTFEGQLYRNLYSLIINHYSFITSAKPQVAKNSAGYALWNVWDNEQKTFDLTRLFVGAQGTLGLMTKAKFRLIEVQPHSEMVVIFLHDISHLGSIINKILPLKPESFEAYDDNTLKLALKFFPSFAKLLGAKNLISTAFSFLPEFLMLLRGGLPKLILQVEFAGKNHEELQIKVKKIKEELASLHPQIRVATDEGQEKKYQLIRHESFNLLRHKIKDKQTAPFIDDFVVEPKYLEQFLPELEKIMKQYPGLIYTVAGHMGEGNFHIIPLMNLNDDKQRAIIPELGQKVYDLVLKYHGSITGEHNDGIIRTPYLKQMFGEEVYKLFEETKRIFDPLNIFNPGKKVGGDLDFALSHIKKG